MAKGWSFGALVDAVLLKSDNLASVADIPTARTNLSIFSKDEVSNNFLALAGNQTVKGLKSFEQQLNFSKVYSGNNYNSATLIKGPGLYGGNIYSQIYSEESVGNYTGITIQTRSNDLNVNSYVRIQDNNLAVFSGQIATLNGNITVNYNGNGSRYQENGDVVSVGSNSIFLASGNNTTLSGALAYIRNRYVNNVYQGYRSWQSMPQAESEWTTPSGHFLTGLHQARIGNLDTWISSIQYAPLWKVYDGGSWII